jgi:uncharacterized membrane protein
MSKYFKYFEYAYLVIVVLFLFKAYSSWPAEPNQTYFSLFFVALALGMFFFKRRFRKKYEHKSDN